MTFVIKLMCNILVHEPDWKLVPYEGTKRNCFYRFGKPKDKTKMHDGLSSRVAQASYSIYYIYISRDEKIQISLRFSSTPLTLSFTKLLILLWFLHVGGYEGFIICIRAFIKAIKHLWGVKSFISPEFGCVKPELSQAQFSVWIGIISYSTL